MCGIACYLGNNKSEGLAFAQRANDELKHRGPDDYGIYEDDNIALVHRRLSIVELSALGHQPMYSTNGKYIIVFNGEIYNHLELRKKHLPDHHFRGHSDTETILELFSILGEKMLEEMVGMWALFIYDKLSGKIFISRDRYGQKPLYTRKVNNGWELASEVKPLIKAGEQPGFNATAIAEYLALGNYGHLGINTFYKDIYNFPQGSYAWLSADDKTIHSKKYWELPFIPEKDKVPFTKTIEKELHDTIVEGVLSQTMADVPIGITLSGGVDSSIVAGILATYYNNPIHIFTAQAPQNIHDETRYVDAVLEKYNKTNFIVHRKNLNSLSVKEDLGKYVNIQEEPFGDPSIIAHGFLMEMAAEAGIKVILNGQGADELFYGYNNMAQAILLKQLKSLQFSKVSENLKAMKLGKTYLARTLFKSAFPGIEQRLRMKSRIGRREILNQDLLQQVDNEMVKLSKYNNLYEVWKESIFGIHIPHLVHYDDRNGMANSIEGRMPFLDHRIADCVAKIKPEYFLQHGYRKYLLRETCKQYLPDLIYKRTDKLGFYTPILTAVQNDKDWVLPRLNNPGIITSAHTAYLANRLNDKNMNSTDALLMWRVLAVNVWMNTFHCQQ